MAGIEDIIKHSSASQIFLANYSAEEVDRAIKDMEELSQAIRTYLIGEVEKMKEVTKDKVIQLLKEA